jgi:hypothetical protein
MSLRHCRRPLRPTGFGANPDRFRPFAPASLRGQGTYRSRVATGTDQIGRPEESDVVARASAMCSRLRFQKSCFLTPKPVLKRQIDQNRKWIIRGIDVLRGVISILKSILDPTFASTGAVPKETFLRRRVRRTPRCSGRAERAVRGDAREARRLAHRGGLHREQRPELHRQRTRHLSARTVARVGRSLGPRNGRRRESDCRPVATVGDVGSAPDYETPLYV